MIRFTAFLEALDVKLEAGQRAFCLVAFDGVQVADLTGEDRAWAVRIFGDLPRMPEEEWLFVLMVVCMIAGGRSGKTYLSSLRLLHLALTVPLNLAPGEQAFAVIFAPRLKEAMQSLRYIAGAAKKHPQIRTCILSDTSEALVIRRPHDNQEVTIAPQAAGAGGISGRGKTLVAVLMDETCFFRDANSGVVNDDAIFDAAQVRVAEGGQTIVASTPWVASGLLYRKHKENHGRPKTALSAHASTRNMRTNKLILRQVDAAYKKDERNAAIEFGAEWGSTTVDLFFTEAELDSLFDGSAPELGRSPKAGERVSFGGDLGFVRNSSTLAGVHELPPTKGRPHPLVLLAHLEEHSPKDGKLKPSVVCKSFARTIAGQGGAGIVADQHERASLDEHLSDAGLAVLSAVSTSDAMVALRARIREGHVKAPEHERLRSQLARTKQKRTIGDKVTVLLPEDLDGSHGDLAAALAQAVWGLGRWGGAEVAPEKTTGRLDPEELAMIEEEEAAERVRLGWL